MFGKKKKEPAYDTEGELPVMRCSICTGEKVAGFKNKETGRFRDVMLIKNETDLELFKATYGVEEVTKEY